MIEQLKAGGFSVMIGDKIVGVAKTSTLSIDKDAELENVWNPEPIKLTGMVKIEDKHPLLEDFLSGMGFNVDATVFQKIDQQKLPRKVKKAFTSYYRRNTKWKRELDKWIMRSRHHLGIGEMKLTEDEMGNIKAVIEYGRNDATSVNVNADTLIKALQERNSHGAGNRQGKATT